MKTPAEVPGSGGPELSPAARMVGHVTFAVAIAGIVSQAIIAWFVLGSEGQAAEFAKGWGFKISIAMAVANLLVCIVHYHKTAMRLDVVTRVLSYVWILITCLYLVAWQRALRGG